MSQIKQPKIWLFLNTLIELCEANSEKEGIEEEKKEADNLPQVVDTGSSTSNYAFVKFSKNNLENHALLTRYDQ